MPEVVGIVVEYNPFHNGHLYQIQKAKELVPGAYILGVMSGNWTQRGEPAIINKWARTASALQSGVDIIIELPVVFSLQSAEGFAMGAIRCLAATGIVNYLCFGSELGELKPLQDLAALLESEPPEFKKTLQLMLKKGLSYPAALQQAVEAAQTTAPCFSFSIINNLFRPNNILAVEYLKALQKTKAHITPLTIRRQGTGYNDEAVKGSFAGATAVRKIIIQKKLNVLKKTVPPPSFQILLEEMKAGRAPVTGESFGELFIALLRRSSPSELTQIPNVVEGMEFRLKRAAASGSFALLLDTLKTKRYTRTRLQRILVNLILGLTKEKIHYFNQEGPCYLRLLGFSKRGKLLLYKMKQNSSLPLVTRPAPFLKGINTAPGAKEMLKYDILATDLYTLGYPLEAQRKAGEDFQKSVVLL
ncbi:MAG: nucleotidyltransferase [Dethiobacteria bacterium]